jgi:hypothetical protein
MTAPLPFLAIEHRTPSPPISPLSPLIQNPPSTPSPISFPHAKSWPPKHSTPSLVLRRFRFLHSPPPESAALTIFHGGAATATIDGEHRPRSLPSSIASWLTLLVPPRSCRDHHRRTPPCRSLSATPLSCRLLGYSPPLRVCLACPLYSNDARAVAASTPSRFARYR